LMILSGRETGRIIPFEGIVYHISALLSSVLASGSSVRIADFHPIPA